MASGNVKIKVFGSISESVYHVVSIKWSTKQKGQHVKSLVRFYYIRSSVGRMWKWAGKVFEYGYTGCHFFML